MLSSVFRAIFSKGLLKFVLAMGILLGLTGLVYFAQTKAEKEMKDYNASQPNDPLADSMIVDNYELKEVNDDNELRWKLVAAQGVLDPGTKDVKLTDINVNYFKEGKLTMKLTAPVGLANELSRMIVLKGDNGKKVVAEGTDKSARMETQRLELTKKNQFIATGGVNIVWPGVAKVKGDKAEGTMANATIDHFFIRGNTRSIVDM